MPSGLLCLWSTVDLKQHFMLSANLSFSLNSLLSQSTWASITKYHRPGGLKDKYWFLMVQEAGKFKIKVPASLVPGSHCHCWMSIATNTPASFRSHSHMGRLASSLELHHKNAKKKKKLRAKPGPLSCSHDLNVRILHLSFPTNSFSPLLLAVFRDIVYVSALLKFSSCGC